MSRFLFFHAIMLLSGVLGCGISSPVKIMPPIVIITKSYVPPEISLSALVRAEAYCLAIRGPENKLLPNRLFSGDYITQEIGEWHQDALILGDLRRLIVANIPNGTVPSMSTYKGFSFLILRTHDNSGAQIYYEFAYEFINENRAIARIRVVEPYDEGFYRFKIMDVTSDVRSYYSSAKVFWCDDEYVDILKNLPCNQSSRSSKYFNGGR